MLLLGLRFLPITFFVVAACGGGDGNSGITGPVDDTFRPECEVECRVEAEEDGCNAPSSCVDDCIAVTSGLDTLCGKCVAESLYTYVEDGSKTCTVEQGSISGESGCETVCTQGTHEPRDSFRAECEVECRVEAEEDGCNAPSSCADDCVSVTLGLDTLCGKCVAESLYTYVEDGSETCTIELGSTSGESGCEEICSQGSHQSRDSFREECEVECRHEALEDGCQLPSSCVDDCVAVTSGLDTLCGKCVAESLYTYVEDGSETCTVEQGSVSGESGCGDICLSSS
ncbi:MAG: hypothetical protein GY811_27520 [Myxococcales bacterium]|nr:hypothetical protein [Myxococcales bacterium]